MGVLVSDQKLAEFKKTPALLCKILPRIRSGIELRFYILHLNRRSLFTASRCVPTVKFCLIHGFALAKPRDFAFFDNPIL